MRSRLLVAKRMLSVVGLIALSVVGWLVPAARGGLPAAQIEEAGNDVLARLEHVDEFLRSGQWDEAVESLRQIMETRGDQLMPVPRQSEAASTGHVLYVPVRELGQMRLAAWHASAPEALAAYRRGVDATAARWLDEATRDRDEVLLGRVVDELMLSSVGDQALLALGDFALERGNIGLARRCWESIHPRMRVPPSAARELGCAPGISWWHALAGRDLEPLWPRLAAAWAERPEPIDWLAYPDTDIPLAAVRARLVFASLLEGSPERAELEFALLRRLHSEGEGVLAGRRGTWVDLLATAIGDASRWPPRASPKGWTTFAGGVNRNRTADAAVDVALRPLWRTPLPLANGPNGPPRTGPPLVAETPDGLLSYHVAVRDGIVYLCQHDAIRALDVATGRPAWPTNSSTPSELGARAGAIFELAGAAGQGIPVTAPRTGVPRYSVTLDGHRLLARMGAPWSGGDGQSPRRDDERSFLVGLDLTTQKLLFDRILPGEPGWEFEGAPVSDGSRLYASLRRRDGNTAQVKVVAYALESGRVIWERFVARAEAIEAALFEWSNSLLAWHDDTLYYQSNLGVVAALRAADGRRLWLARYPRAGPAGRDPRRNDRHVRRDMTPCLIDGGLVMVAAADCDCLFALDATRGQPIWRTAADVAVDAVHLLGVGQGRLVASGDYLYWLDTRTGALVGQFPAPRTADAGFAGPEPRGHGRGVLAAQSVYWPTRDRIYVFDQRGPRQVRQPIDLAAAGVYSGHVVVDRGVMLIASRNELVALAESGRVEKSAARDTEGPAAEFTSRVADTR